MFEIKFISMYIFYLKFVSNIFFLFFFSLKKKMSKKGNINAIP